jgi:hypothetical protein
VSVISPLGVSFPPMSASRSLSRAEEKEVGGGHIEIAVIGQSAEEEDANRQSTWSFSPAKGGRATTALGMLF